MKRIKHKFNAVQTILDGIKFPSKKEAARYSQLKRLQQAGEVVFFLRQVPFHLPGNVTYRLDYMVFWADETITFEDSKGMRTAIYILKLKMVEALYPIKITEL